MCYTSGQDECAQVKIDMSENRLKTINRLGVILKWVYKVNLFISLFFVIGLIGVYWGNGNFDSTGNDAPYLLMGVLFLSVTLLSWGLLRAYEEFMKFYNLKLNI